jgi:hypothetical protein
MTREMSLLESRRGEVIATTGLGVTLYFGASPTLDEILAAYIAFRHLAPDDTKWLVKNVRGAVFELLEREDVRQLRRLLRDQDRRRDEGLILWDGSVVPGWSLCMRGVVAPDDARRPIASFCQVLMPFCSPPAILRSLAAELAETLPLLSGHGGYTTTFEARLKSRAFDRIFGWAKRYRGLEVEDLNVTLGYVLDGIKGANWLTLVGDKIWQRLPLSATDAISTVAEIERHGGSRLIAAGTAPSLTDRNRGEFPDSYAAVERILAPIKIADHGDFSGRFREDGSTKAWLSRLLDPQGW